MPPRSPARRPRVPPGLYWAPGKLHGCETLMAIDATGEMTLRTVEPGTEGNDAFAQLEGWLKDRGVEPQSSGPALFVL